MPVELAETAELDLEEVWWSGAERFGTSAATSYLRGLNDCFETLADFPESSPVVSEVPNIRARHHKAHVVLYRINMTAERIFVLRIRHHREDWLRQLWND